MACDLVAWSRQVRIHISPLCSCFPCATSHLLTSSLTNTIAYSSSHQHTVLPAIDSLQESQNDSRRSDIHAGNVTSRNNLRREIKFVGMKAGVLHCPQKKDKDTPSKSERFISIGSLRRFLKLIVKCTRWKNNHNYK